MAVTPLLGRLREATTTMDDWHARRNSSVLLRTPTYPLAELQQIVAGIKNLGYTFVSPASLPG